MHVEHVIMRSVCSLMHIEVIIMFDMHAYVARCIVVSCGSEYDGTQALPSVVLRDVYNAILIGGDHDGVDINESRQSLAGVIALLD